MRFFSCAVILIIILVLDQRMASPHATFLKATKLKLNQEERLANNAIINICRAKYTADDIAEGSNIDTAFLYDQVQGKLRRSVNPKILIVMKSRLQAGAFAQILRRHGCDVIVATNGHKAYTSYLRKDSADFSLCLCQWYLPGIAGRDLAYYEAESGGRLPFVALLGHNQRATDAIRSGADLFLKLPLFPHLRSILSLVLPHTSAMAQFRVGAMQSNFEGMRRLLSTQQDVLRHTVETNTLMELVKSDLASVSEISSVEVGMNMLEAVMASIRMQEATAANLAASRKNPTEVLSAQKRSSKKNTRKSLKANSTPEPDSTFDEPAPTHDAQFHALATSFRNVMLVLNRVRNSLISTQQENHALREKSSRSVEQAELLRGQLRSFGVDVIDAKLERLYLPRRLTRSPPPRDSSEAFHANIENDPDVDVTTFSKQDLMRALRSAKAAITSSNDEISELMEDLQHLQDYQIEVEDDLIHSGMAVHFNIGVRDEDASKNRSGKIGDDALKTLVRKRSQSRIQDNEAGGRLLRTLSMLGPRLQDEFIRQQSVADDGTASIDESRDQESVGARTPLQLKSEPKRRGFSSPVAAPFVVSSDGEFHIQRSKKKKEEVSKVFFARRFFWTAHVLQALESQCMSNEDARQVASSKVVRPVPPVPKCLEKPNPVVTNAIEGVVNGVIALHNQLALQVNTCTAKVGATFPTASQSLRDLSIGVKDALQGFNVSQHVTALQLHVEGVITKMIGAERELWNNERFEMEKYKLQNPPGSRKLIADLRGTVRELRLRRWRDWFQTIETKVRANYLRKWIVWFLHRQGEKTWKSKSKQLEIEMQSTNTKKVAEQVAFARKQSVDVLAKQSQQRVDYEQLQIKHMRVSQLYDEARVKTAALTIENETLVAQVSSLSEKKDNLEAKVCEKTDEIVRLMQSVGPLEEELMVARTTLEDRDQKNLSLQAQVSAYHRKVQQLSNKGSFLGLPQPKATQTAISNANSALLLDNIVKTLGARQFSNSFDMSTLERKLSGSGSAFTVTLPDADEFFSSHPLMDSDDEEPSANNDEILSSPNSMRGGPDASQKVPEVQQPSKQAPKPSPKKTLVGTGKGRSKSVTSIPIARQGKQTQSMRMPSRTMSISSAMESSLNPPNHLGSSKNSTRSSVSPSSEAASKFTRTPSTSHSNSPQTKDLVLGGNVDRFESRSPTPPPINGFKPSDESLEGAGCPPPEAATLRDNDDTQQLDEACAPSDRDHSEVFPLDQRPADVEFDEVPSRTDASMQSEKVPVGKKPRKTKSVSALPVSSFDTSSGASSPNHLNVPRKRAVSLSGSFASDVSGAHISAQGSGEYAESIPASILASTESPHQRAGNQTRVLPPSPLVSNGSMLFDSPQVLFVDQSQSAMSLPLMVAVGVQSSFTDASIFLPPALTESISNVQHAGGSLRISPQASPKTSPRTISGQPHVTEEFPDSVHPNAAQNRTSLDMSDTSRWQSALRDLARSRTSVAAAATSPTSLTAINSGIGNVVDSTRRLLEAMSIPQNVLVKTTSPAEMLDSLCSVLEAAFAAVTSNQSRVHGYTSNNTSMRSVPSPSAPPGTSPDAAAGRSRAASIYTKKTDQHESSSHLPNIAETPRGRVVPLHKDASRTVLSSDQRDALPPIFERKPPTTKPSSTSISPQENVIHRVDPAMYRSHLDGDNNDGVSKPSPRSATVQLQPQQVETREKKQREKERKAAQTNIAVLLQREMLRRPAPVNSSEQNGLSPHPPTETLSPLQPRGSRRAL
ncbi:bacterial-type response regulator-like protein, putative [Bodo saltans]|uniref:Bacterial-type response regulator-like protein, putative n=1 Tax=Bodo saltans TaxID=75058 RepID=A0A0S4IRD9_BODSA|nr:bacterial-type response regulator-like protein, putative [Bodo saltans]|eukprot:CUF30460.1 bacterial-type response regulator-like protein, putative [Bodo saltans]